MRVGAMMRKIATFKRTLPSPCVPTMIAGYPWSDSVDMAAKRPRCEP